jgi:hypothetical protein
MSLVPIPYMSIYTLQTFSRDLESGQVEDVPLQLGGEQDTSNAILLNTHGEQDTM